MIQSLNESYPDLHILITCSTIHGIQVLENHIFKQTIKNTTCQVPPFFILFSHLSQFYPIDVPRFVEKFLDHWKPNGIIWIESEFWPNMLSSINKRKSPAILLNGRMSKKSFRVWKMFRKLISATLQTFQVEINISTFC